MNKHKQISTIISIIIIGALSACNNFKQEPMAGQYAGEIYSDNEMGGYLVLSFNGDDSCALTSHFYDSDDTFSTQKGKWSQNNQKLTLTFDTCIIKANIVDTNKLEITAFGSKGILEREVPLTKSAFIGKYILSGMDGEGGFEQFLTIADGGQDYLLISFSSTDNKGEILFKHKGKIVNNQIDIPLKELNKQMTSTMIIRIEADNEINVSTSDFDQRYDLQYFCKGGGSLAGVYIKQMREE